MALQNADIMRMLTRAASLNANKDISQDAANPYPHNKVSQTPISHITKNLRPLPETPY